MTDRTTGSTLAEVMVPVAAGAVILGAVATLIWLTTRKTGALAGAPAKNVRVDPHMGAARPRALTRKAFTDGPDSGYDLDVEGEDVT